jgi:hypothetical protein
VLGPVNTGPDVTCPEGIAAECVNGGANILVGAEVFDADGDPLAIEWAVTFPDGSVTTIADTVTFDNPPAPIRIALDSEGFFFPHGNSSVQLRVTDGIAESHACSPVTITVEDTAGPVIVTLMELIEVGNDPGNCFAAVDLSPGSEYAPVFSDLCSPEVAATNNAPETFPLGETIVTWTVNDGHGNSTTATQTVVVYDREAPIATAPADIVVPHDPGYPAATLASLGTPAASDNCGVADISNDAPAVFPLGATEVKWYVSDAAGNTTIVTQRVEVTNASPVADAGLSQILECTSTAGVQYTLNGAASFDPDAGDTELLTFQWSAVDGVGDPIVFDNPDSPTPTATFPLGSTTVTLTVTDICGDTTSDYVIIVVDDTQAPVIEVMITDRDILQVPNHNMVPVNLRLLVRDTCELPQLLQVTCVATSSEPDDGRGDG